MGVGVGARRGRPSRAELAVAAGLFGLLGAWTALALGTPALRFEVFLPRARVPMETVGAVVALLVATLAYLRYSLRGPGPWLLLSLAFLVLALNHLALGVVLVPSELGLRPRQEFYFWTAGRLLAGGLLLAAAVGRWDRSEPPLHPLRDLLAGGAAVLGVFGGLLLTLWAGREDLPPLSSVGEVTDGFPGALPGLTGTNVALGTVGAGLFLGASGAVLLRAGGQAFPGWLGPGLLLAAFSHLHYMFLPTVFTTRVSTGDLLRLGFSVILLGGLVWEVRALFLSERRRAASLAVAYEAARERARELEELERGRAELFAILTHELANPVAALRGQVLTLQRWEGLDEATRERLLQRMERESARLRDLAEEAVTVTHLDGGRPSLALKTERAVELVREAADLAHGLEGRLRVRVQPGAEDALVEVDVGRVLQVFRNLLSNAEKYTEPDTPVEVRVEAGEEEVTFRVVDRGPGIAPEDLPRLFARFSRVPTPGREHVPGAGLGLYICKRIVEAHGGRIWATSAPGEGSTFSFALPRAHEQGAPAGRTSGDGRLATRAGGEEG